MFPNGEFTKDYNYGYLDGYQRGKEEHDGKCGPKNAKSASKKEAALAKQQAALIKESKDKVDAAKTLIFMSKGGHKK